MQQYIRQHQSHLGSLKLVVGLPPQWVRGMRGRDLKAYLANNLERINEEGGGSYIKPFLDLFRLQKQRAMTPAALIPVTAEGKPLESKEEADAHWPKTFLQVFGAGIAGGGGILSQQDFGGQAGRTRLGVLAQKRQDWCASESAITESDPVLQLDSWYEAQHFLDACLSSSGGIRRHR